MSLPTGKSDTLAYLKKLDDFQPHWIYVKSQRPPIGTLLREVNPALPQVPPLTTFALVRMANLIDANGEPVNSPLMESVQLRVIRTLSGGYQHATQSPFLFTLDQVKVMRGEGGLVAQKSQQAFEMVLRRLMTISNDRLERSYNSNGGSAGGAEVPLSNCMTCHSGGGEGGILSMNSYTEFFLFDQKSLTPPDLHEGNHAGSDSLKWKKHQHDWSLLQAYWFQ